jgi:hypothetical protein
LPDTRHVGNGYTPRSSAAKTKPGDYEYDTPTLYKMGRGNGITAAAAATGDFTARRRSSGTEQGDRGNVPSTKVKRIPSNDEVAIKKIVAHYDARMSRLPECPTKRMWLAFCANRDAIWQMDSPTLQQVEDYGSLLRDEENRVLEEELTKAIGEQSGFTKVAADQSTRQRMGTLEIAEDKRFRENESLFRDLKMAEARGDLSECELIKQDIKINAFKGAFAGLGHRTLLLASVFKDAAHAGKEMARRASEFFTDKVCNWFALDSQRDLRRYEVRRQVLSGT